MNIIKVMGESSNYKDALQGVWGYEGRKDVFLTIVKGVGFLQSVVFDEDTDIDIKLPSCYDFLAQVSSENGVRFVKVTGSRFVDTLSKGEQLNTNFKVK